MTGPARVGTPSRRVGLCRPWAARLVRNGWADVMRPLRFTTPPGGLPGLDRAPAGPADLSGGVGEVIFLRRLIAWAEVGICKFPALARDKALLWCVSGGHLRSFPRPVATSRHGATASSMAQASSSSRGPPRPARPRRPPEALPSSADKYSDRGGKALGTGRLIDRRDGAGWPRLFLARRYRAQIRDKEEISAGSAQWAGRVLRGLPGAAGGSRAGRPRELCSRHTA